MYRAVAANTEGLLAVTDEKEKCVHLLTKEGALVRSIGKGVLDGMLLYGVSFDLKGNVWVADYTNHIVVKLSQDGRLLQTIHHAGSESDHLSHPRGVSVSPEGLIYICDSENHRVTVHDEDGKFMFSFCGSVGSGPGHFDRPHNIAFGTDGLIYVTDIVNSVVSVWSKEGTFRRDFEPKYDPTYIAATSDHHLLITSSSSSAVMVYTLGCELVHEFRVGGSHPGKFNEPRGVCVDDRGVVYVTDCLDHHVQVF